jgi:hypothetical protein
MERKDWTGAFFRMIDNSGFTENVGLISMQGLMASRLMKAVLFKVQ